jgi:hypothetical protein
VGKKKSAVLILRLPPALLAVLRREARRQGISVSELVRQASAKAAA